MGGKIISLFLAISYSKNISRDQNITTLDWHKDFYSEHEQYICIRGNKCTPHVLKQTNVRDSFIPQPGILISLINNTK